MSCAAALFVKTPGFSAVKTRLAASVGDAAAVRVHRAGAAAVSDVLRACRPWLQPYHAIAESDPAAAAEWTGLPHLLQGAGDLGERLHQVHAALQARHGAVLLLGADTPQLRPELLRQAVAVVAGPTPSAVFGAALDGGFWLFGCNRPIAREVWTAVSYSRADTGAALLAALQAAYPQLPVTRLAGLQDLDELDDVPAVLAALRALPAPLPEQARMCAVLEELLHRTATGAARDSHAAGGAG